MSLERIGSGLVGCALCIAAALSATPAAAGQPEGGAPPGDASAAPSEPPAPREEPPPETPPPDVAPPPADAAPAPSSGEPEPPPAWQWPPPHVPRGWSGASNLPASQAGPGPRAAADGEAAPSPEESAPLPRDLDHLLFAELGFRSVLVADEGFEPYADGDLSLLGQLAIAAHALPLKFSPMTIGIGAEYDLGNRSEVTRGQSTSLTVHRLAGSVLVDATIIRHLHTFARFAPGALYLHGSIEDAALPGRPLTTNPWTWAIDTTGGVSVLLGAAGDDQAPAVGFWLSAEFGYCFAGDVEMRFTPEADEDDSRQFGEVRMPDLNPGGVVNRFALGLTF